MLRKLFLAVSFAAEVSGLSCGAAYAGGSGFVWTQLDMGSACGDPYSGTHKQVLEFLASVTSVEPLPSRRFVKIKDDRIFESPFLFLSCLGAPADIDDDDARRLRRHLSSGGTLWIEDTAGQDSSVFDRWVRRALAQVFPENPLQIINPEHAVYKSFFLVKSAEGRVKGGYLEGIDWGGRSAVIYSKNDLLGVWPVDALGRPLYQCLPGAEEQRLQGKMLGINIIMYSLTGSYKLDAVHQPFLLEKLRRAGEIK